MEKTERAKPTRNAENRTKAELIQELKEVNEDNASKARALRYQITKTDLLTEERDEYRYGFIQATHTVQRLMAMRRGDPVPKTRSKMVKVRRPVADISK